jgi:transcription elongation factor Elf1
MTIFGGEETAWGTKIGGFFITCTKCGWESKVSIKHEDSLGFKDMIISCGQCGNEYREDITDTV